MRSGINRNLKCKCIEDSRLIGCNVHEVVYNQMFNKMTFLLTESLELVEGNEASGPADPAGEESFDCEGGRGSKATSNELRESRCALAHPFSCFSLLNPPLSLKLPSFSISQF